MGHCEQLRSFPSVTLDNFLQVSEGELLIADLEEANFNNCIIYGSEQRELGLAKEAGAAFNFNFNHSLIRFEDPQGNFEGNPDYNFSNASLYTSCTFNQDPSFQEVTLNNYNIETGTSGAEDIADPSVSAQVPFDLSGILRSATAPDAGAYESTVFPIED
ncbi:MAG: hypothetical protein R2773_05920 [Flavobacteriaceae bacterium]